MLNLPKFAKQAVEVPSNCVSFKTPNFAKMGFSKATNHKVFKTLPSITLTLNVTLAVFPDGSVKVYVTGVVPTGKKSLGDLVLLTKVAMPELSDAVGSG